MRTSEIQLGKVAVPGKQNTFVYLNKVRGSGLKDAGRWNVIGYYIFVGDAEGGRMHTNLDGIPCEYRIRLAECQAVTRQGKDIACRREAYDIFFSTIKALASWTEDVNVAI